MLATFARFPSIRRENVSEWIRYDGYEHFERALEKGKGVLFATAHLGNWELSAFAHALLAAPMSIVVRPLDNPLLDALATKYRSLSGNTVLGKRDSARAILRALERNEAVGILVDQNVGLDEGIFIDFFGRKACVSPTFARIARRTGATVIPGFAVWNGVERRYLLRFYDPLEMTGDEREDTQRIQAAVELAVREYPEQWLWAHRRWKTRPAGEAGLY
jgi:KDO2-lipid IV(A) lauroyltransferase